MKLTVQSAGDLLRLNYTEDVETLLRWNHERREAETAFDKMGDLHHTMRVPQTVMMDIREKYGWDFMNKDHWPMVKKILTGPEYAQWRVTKRKF